MNRIDGKIPRYPPYSPSLQGKRWMILFGVIALIGAIGFLYAHYKLGTPSECVFGSMMGGGIIAIPITHRIDIAPIAPIFRLLDYYQKTHQPLLHTACSLGDVKAIKWLIDRGDKLDYNGAQWEPSTPLRLAVMNNHLETVKLLITEYNVDINQKSYSIRETALHRAVQNKNFEIAKYLLEQGANPNLSDGEGKLPLFYASNQPVMSQLLISYGAKKEVPKESLSPNQTSPFDTEGQNL